MFQTGQIKLTIHIGDCLDGSYGSEITKAFKQDYNGPTFQLQSHDSGSGRGVDRKRVCPP